LYSAPNLSYRQIDVVTWQDLSTGESAGTVDYLVSFDTIEHLLYREIMLINVAESISPNGVFLLSTPCGHEDNVLNPGWEHHKIEYSYRYLRNLMRRFFNQVLIPDDGSLPKLEFWTDVINKDRQRYLLRTNPIACLQPKTFGLAGRFESQEA
jgi:hypothetical protein